MRFVLAKNPRLVNGTADIKPRVADQKNFEKGLAYVIGVKISTKFNSSGFILRQNLKLKETSRC